MSLDVSEVKLYGPADVRIGGVTMGHTTMEGIKVKRTPKIAEAKVAKFGDTPVGKWQDGEKITVEFTLAQSDFSLLVQALPGATLVTDSSSGNQKLTFGKIAGSSLSPIALTLIPFVAANTPYFDITIPQAVSIGEFEVNYVGEKFNGFKCIFEGLIDEGSTDGAYLWTLGDAAASANAVAPTFTVAPTDHQTLAAPASIVWTFSKNMDALSIKDGSDGQPATVLVFEINSSVGTTSLQKAGVATLINAGTGTTLTFVPTVAFAGSKTYGWILQDLKAQDGNALPFNVGDFVTS